MEVDFFDSNVVHFGLGLAKALKHGRGVLFGARGDARFFDDIEDVFEVPMRLAVAAEYPELRGRDASPRRFFDFKTSAGAERIERLEECCGVGARVEQSANSNVSADAGERVKVANLHAMSWGSSSPEGPCRNSSI